MMNFEKNTNMYKRLQKASLPQAALKTNNHCVFDNSNTMERPPSISSEFYCEVN